MSDATGSAVLTASVAAAPDPMASQGLFVMALLTYYKFINIDYPDNLWNYLQQSKATKIPLHFGLKIPQAWKESFTKRQVNDVFARYEFPSSFILNYW